MLIKPPRLRRPYQQASLEPGHGPPAAPRPGRSLASTPQALACLQSNPGRVQTSGLQSPEQDGPLDTCSPMPPRATGPLTSEPRPGGTSTAHQVALARAESSLLRTPRAAAPQKEANGGDSHDGGPKTSARDPHTTKPWGLRTFEVNGAPHRCLPGLCGPCPTATRAVRSACPLGSAGLRLCPHPVTHGLLVGVGSGPTGAGRRPRKSETGNSEGLASTSRLRMHCPATCGGSRGLAWPWGSLDSASRVKGRA